MKIALKALILLNFLISGGAFADGVDPQKSYLMAQELLQTARANLIQYNGPNEILGNVNRLIELLPDQKFLIIQQNQPEYSSQCFGKDPFTGLVREFPAFMRGSSCMTQITGGAMKTSCEIVFCPKGLNQSQSSTTHLILHELGHVAFGMDECVATRNAMLVFKWAGLKPLKDGYVDHCQLGELLN